MPGHWVTNTNGTHWCKVKHGGVTAASQSPLETGALTWSPPECEQNGYRVFSQSRTYGDDSTCFVCFVLFFLWQQERCVHFFMYRQFFLGGTSDTSLDVQLWPFIQIWSFRKSFLTPLCQKHWLKLNGVAEQSGDLMCLLLLIISTVNYRCLCSNWGYILYLLWPRIRVVSDFRVEIRSDQK